VVLAGCTKQSSSTPTPTSAGTVPPTTPPPGSTSTAAGGPLPAGCKQGRPAAGDTVAFVAEGFAWSLNPDGRDLTCLFPVGNPGPFEWGPLGDRALLGGLEMEQIGGKELHPTTSVKPGATAWGHPMGLAVVFVSHDGTELEKAYPGKKTIDDISPLGKNKGVTYKNVIYHPSGLALAWVATSKSGDSIYLSSNLGTDPQKLVFSLQGT